MTYPGDAPDAMSTRRINSCCWSTQYHEGGGYASSLAGPNSLALESSSPLFFSLFLLAANILHFSTHMTPQDAIAVLYVPASGRNSMEGY